MRAPFIVSSFSPLHLREKNRNRASPHRRLKSGRYIESYPEWVWLYTLTVREEVVRVPVFIPEPAV